MRKQVEESTAAESARRATGAKADFRHPASYRFVPCVAALIP